MTTCVHSSLALTMEVRHECFERCHVTFASDKLWNGAEKTALPFFFFIQKTHHSSKENTVFSLHSVKKKNIYLYIRQSNRVSVWFPVVNRNVVALAFLLELSISIFLSRGWDDTVLPVGVGTISPVARNKLLSNVMFCWTQSRLTDR